ncbi:hypothetical protein [Nonomuraea sp. bgisy101]|uniref:WXG100-like domain-containing protein n=1 Tax=Nonomuraea sp. bgisy101 TaxID=3413784 RepID=UPI003D75DC2F
MTTNSIGTDTIGQGGQASRQGAVKIDRDVTPAWETDALPDWVVYVVIPLLSAGQKWPEASESKLSELAQAWDALGDGMQPYTEPAGKAVRAIVSGYQAPSTATFTQWARTLFGSQSGVAGVRRNSAAYSAKTSDFAVETQYSKLSINVAFWVTVVAIAIWLFTAFFTAGSTAPLVGPYAAAARAAISRILVRLATLAGREVGAVNLARVTALSGATGRGLITRVLGSPVGKELVEEMGEEGFIDGWAQHQQIQMGTREEWDWQKSRAALIGAGTGAVVGMGVAGPVSRITSGVPGFAGRALNTGLTNMVASPAGSFVANGVVYGQWTNPFSEEALQGAFWGGVGRTTSISPFNPEVFTALAHPTTSLATAYDLAAASDAARAGMTGPYGGSPPPGSPMPNGPDGGPNGPGPTAGTAPVPTAPSPVNTTSTSTRPSQPVGAGSPHAGQASQDPGDAGRRATPQGDLDPSGSRRTTDPDRATDPDRQTAPAPDEREEQDERDERSRPTGTPSAATTSEPAVMSDPASPAAATGESATDPAPLSPQAGDGTGAQQAGEPAAGETTGDTGGDTSADTDVSADTAPETGSDGVPDTAPDGVPDTDAQNAPDTATAPAGQDTSPSTDGRNGTRDQDTQLAQGGVLHAARARDAVTSTLIDNYPNTVMLPDGSLIVPMGDTDVVLPAAAVNRLTNRLQERARQVGDTQLRADAKIMLDAQLADAAQDEFSPLLAAAQPAGLRAHGAMRYAVSSLAPAAVELADGSLVVSDARGDYVISGDLLARLRFTLEASAHAHSSPAMLRTQALAALTEVMEFSAVASPAPAPVASRPGTVTARPVAGTRFVTNARPDGSRLSLDRIHAAIDELLASDFQNEGVLGWEWNGLTLIVTTQSHGKQHFRPRLFNIDPGLMAETTVSADSSTTPHMVTFNETVADDQVARIWLHEITDTLHRLAAPASQKQGVVRRMLPGGGRKETVDECVPARLNEHAFLARQWLATPQSPERQRIRLDLDGVARELRAHGHVPPTPPWTPTTVDRSVHTPNTLTGAATDEALREVIDALVRAEAELATQIKSKQDSAEKAGEDAKAATKEAEKQSKMKDRAKDARARKEEKESEKHLAKQERDLRIAQAYEQALAKAKQTRAAYEKALGATVLSERSSGQEKVLAAATARDALRTAGELHTQYKAAVDKALPLAVTLSSALPTARLPHLTKLTDELNELLKTKGVNQRFTPSELEHIIRADFRVIVSNDGLVMRVGDGEQSAEIKIKLDLADMVEILNPEVKASEIMLGTLPQGGRTIKATEAGSTGFNGGIKLAQFAPEGGWAKALLDITDPSVGAAAGRGWSRGPSSAEYFLGGTVEDNRGESMLFDAAATWTVQIRSAKTNGWEDGITVASGHPDDANSMRFWVAHTYADQAPGSPEYIDPAKRVNVLPESVVSNMSGLNKLADDVLAEFDDEHTAFGSVVRDQVRIMMTEDLPSNLGEAVNSKLGMIRDITDDTGRPIATVTVKSRVVVESAVMVGGRSRDHWMERLRVGFSVAAGGGGVSGFMNAFLSGGLGFSELENVDGPGEYTPTIGPGWKGSRSVSRSQSAFVNDQAIHPSVQRITGHTQGYQVRVVHEVSVQHLTGAQARRPVRGDSRALIRMPEADAYRYGLPVSRDALMRDKGKPILGDDGVPVLVDDPKKDPPKGRLGQPPSWLGDGPGQLRGAGPALVQKLEGVDEFALELLKKLSVHGVVPKVNDDGTLEYSGNRLEQASQRANLREVLRQVNPQRLEAGYDQAAQDGIPIDLVHYGFNRAPEHYTVNVKLKQKFKDPRTRYVGRTEGLAVVNLDIGSDTAGRASGRGWNMGAEGSLGFGDGPEEGQDGLTHKVGGSANAAYSRNIGSSAATTYNRVGLGESDGEVALINMEHELSADIFRNGTKVDSVDAVDGRAQLVFAADLLPSAKPRHTHTISQEALADLMPHAMVAHMDTTGMEQALKEVLSTGMRPDSPAFHYLAAAANVRSLIAHPEWYLGQYGAGLGVRPQGALPTQAGFTISGDMTGGTVLEPIAFVMGDIGLSLGSAGISWGGSLGYGTGSSLSMSDLDDHGASRDGGSGNHSRSAGRSRGKSILDIFGVEVLTILLGNHIPIIAEVDLAITGTEGKANPAELGGNMPGTPKSTHRRAKVLMFVPEYHMLLSYADGKDSMSLQDVGDAVERFINGTLTLDRSLATSLLPRYLAAVQEARARNEDVSFADEHTPEALMKALAKVDGLAPAMADPDAQGKTPEELLDGALSRAIALTEELSNVQVAPQYAGVMGLSGVESFTMTNPDTKQPVGMLDAVTAAVDQVAPGALANDPTFARSLSGDLAIDRSEGYLDAMLSDRGFVKGYPTVVNTTSGRSELVTVRAKLVPKGEADKGKLIGHNPHAGLIRQLYGYLETGVSRGYNASNGFGLEESSGDKVDGDSLGLSTDRGRSFSANVSEQRTKMQRFAQFGGLDRLMQEYTLEITVEVAPMRRGPFRTRTRKAVDWVTRKTRKAGPIRLDAQLVRLLPKGMTRPASTSENTKRVVDTRRFHIPPKFMVSSIQDAPNKPTLFDVIVAELSKRGERLSQKDLIELEARTSPVSLASRFGQLAGEGGYPLIRNVRKGFRNQGTNVQVEGHLSDLEVLTEPFEAELGEVDREMRTSNLGTGRSRVLPVAGSMGDSNEGSGTSSGISAGEQASEGVSEVNGRRVEASEFMKGKVVLIRARVDWDLTFQDMARLPDGVEKSQGKPKFMPGAATSVVDMAIFEADLKEIRAMQARGYSVRWNFDEDGRPTYRFVPELAEMSLVQQLTNARIKARETGELYSVEIRKDGKKHTYVVAPNGSIHSMTADGGFAEAIATLPPEVLDALEANPGVDLYEIFMDSTVLGTFTDQVIAYLKVRNVNVEPAKPTWPVQQAESAAPDGGSAGQLASAQNAGGAAAGGISAPSPAIPGTLYDAHARPADMPTLSMPELVGQDVAAGDIGVDGLTWTNAQGLPVTPGTVGDHAILVVSHGGVDQHMRVAVGVPGDGLLGSTDLRSGTAEDPHLTWIAPGTHPAVVSSVLVHEITHVAQEQAAAAAGAPQGAARTSLSESEHAEGTDHCLTPRLNEHAHMSRKWAQATDPVTQSSIADAIDTIAADITRRGHTPPLPPWGSGPRVTETGPSKITIADLLGGGGSPSVGAAVGALPTSPDALRTLATQAGVASITPTDRPGVFTVNAGASTFTLALTETDTAASLPTGTGLTVGVSSNADAASAAADAAGRIAGHVAQMAGRPATSLLGRGPAPAGLLTGTPAFGVPDAVTFARLRSLAEALAGASLLTRGGVSAALRAEAETAGLVQGTPGATARLVAAARAGELSPAHIAAIQGTSITLPEIATAQAVERTATAMGVAVRDLGRGIYDILLPGSPPMSVHVTRGDHPGMVAVEDGVLVYHVANHFSIGANERAVASLVAGALAEALGMPTSPTVLSGDPNATVLTVNDLRALAELGEAVRQVATATAQQRTSRMRVFAELAHQMGLMNGGVERFRATVNGALLDQVAALIDGPQPRGVRDYLERMRRIANGTGWYPPEREYTFTCLCPVEAPCVCGRRVQEDSLRA